MTPRPARSGHRRSRAAQRSMTLWYAVAIALILLTWQIATWLGAKSYVLPTIADVARGFHTYRSALIENTWPTVSALLTSFIAAILIGTIVAAGMAFIRPVERAMTALLVILQTVPKVALGPLFIGIIGVTWRSVVVLGVIIAVFPIVINTVLGFTSIEDDLLKLGRSMGGSRTKIFLKIRLPYALPSILSGWKLGITMALIGVVVGEFVASDHGLGYLALAASGNQNTVLIFCTVVALSTIGLVSFSLVSLLERILLHWHVSQRRM